MFQSVVVNKEREAEPDDPLAEEGVATSTGDVRKKGSTMLKEKFLKLLKFRKTSASEGETSTKTPTEAGEIPTTVAGNVGTKKKTTDFSTKCQSEVVCKRFTEDEMSNKMYSSENECVSKLLLEYLKSEPNINFVFFDELHLRDTSYQKRGRHDLELLKDCSELTSIEGMWLCLHRQSALQYSNCLLYTSDAADE